MKTKPYGSLEEVRKDLESKGLIGKHASEILSKHPALYHRVYSYGRRVDKTPNRLWADVGVLTGQELVSTHDELVDWAAKHKVIGKRVCDISGKHISKLQRYAKAAEKSLEDVYRTLGIDNEYMIVYKSIDDVRKDLANKGLVGKTPKAVMNYDGHTTYCNMRYFAERQKMSLSVLYGLVGIHYSDKTEIVDGAVKAKIIYQSVDDIKQDLKDKGLVSKSLREVDQYDSTKTCMLIRGFASRNNIDIRGFWKELGITASERLPYVAIPDFSSVRQIKSWIETEGISLDLKQFRVVHKAAYRKILEFSVKKGIESGAIWEKLGVTSDKEMIHSIEGVIALLSKHSLRKATIKTIRNHGNGKVYKAISNFTSKKKIKMDKMWEMLGIKPEYHKKRYRSDSKEVKP